MRNKFILIFIISSICLLRAEVPVLLPELIYEGLLTTSSNPLVTDILGEKQFPKNNDAPYIIGVKTNEIWDESIVIYEDRNGDGVPEQYNGGYTIADSMYFYSKADMSLYKKFCINNISWISSVAKGVYTKDKDLTCFVGRVNSGCPDESYYGVFIYNEDGEQIAILEVGEYEIVRTEIVQIGNSYKLFINCKESATYVFPLSGDLSSATVNTTAAKHFAKPYPNPTNGNINLPYELSTEIGQMLIYDIKGQLIETRLITSHKELLELNTQVYPAGLYFYEVEGTSQSFIVKK